MANKVIKLTESELRNIIKESVTNILNEVTADTAKNAYYTAYDNMAKNPRSFSDKKRKQMDNLYHHYDKRQSDRDNLDMNMPVIIVGGDKQGRYIVQDLFDNFEITGHVEPFTNSAYKDSKIVGYPRIAGYLGPMWDGDKLRYETQEAYDFFST